MTFNDSCHKHASVILTSTTTVVVYYISAYVCIWVWHALYLEEWAHVSGQWALVPREWLAAAVSNTAEAEL